MLPLLFNMALCLRCDLDLIRFFSWLTHSQDINHSGDGGIYAELITNRAFQGSAVFPSTLSGWSSVGGDTLSLQNLSNPVSSALPTSMNVAIANGTTGQVGFSNTSVTQKLPKTIQIKADFAIVN